MTSPEPKTWRDTLSHAGAIWLTQTATAWVCAAWFGRAPGDDLRQSASEAAPAMLILGLAWFVILIFVPALSRSRTFAWPWPLVYTVAGLTLLAVLRSTPLGSSYGVLAVLSIDAWAAWRNPLTWAIWALLSASLMTLQGWRDDERPRRPAPAAQDPKNGIES